MLDRCCDLMGIIELGEPGLPWAMRLHGPLDILPQIAEAFPFMIPCALVVHLATHPCNGVGSWTVCWSPA
jgi:hypothetical protein